MLGELKVLQYNVHKKKEVMELLLGLPATQELDIIAIQDPWLNTHEVATFCPRRCAFVPVFSSSSKRSCLLINRKLDPNRWKVQISDRDLCTIELQLDQGTLQIHSVYAEPPCSFTKSLSEYTNPIGKLNEHIRI
jgi:hypothetical protein